jgi:hypothetical protein
MTTKNFTEGIVYEFLEEHCKVAGRGPRSVVTHTCMTGGRYHVDSEKIHILYDKMARCLTFGDCIPCLTEQRTSVFPLYVDFDMKLKSATLDNVPVVMICSILSSQLKKFYPERESPMYCICLTKRGPPSNAGCGFFKHGLHIHFPRINVVDTQAYQIRESFVAGLRKNNSELESLLSTKGIDWNDVVDRSVYTNGLRMMGAPKASSCKECKANDPSCKLCKRMNNRNIVDERYYRLCMVLVDGVSNETVRNVYRKAPAQLYEEVSVRMNTPSQTPTSGYKVYDGCPPVPMLSSKKRKINSDITRLERRFKQGEIVETGRNEIKAILASHGKVYAESTIDKVVVKEKEMRVTLTGDNSTYCFNKQGYHKSNRVYMVIQKDTKQDAYYSWMRCFCPCKVKRPGRMMNCSDYKSESFKLTFDQAKVLFPKNEKKEDDYDLDCLTCNVVSVPPRTDFM